MKKAMIFFTALLMMGCSSKPSYKYTQPSEEQEETAPQVEPVDSSLVNREYDEFDQKTTVSYAGKFTNKDITFTASYLIKKVDDITKETLSTPLVEDYKFTIIAKKRGATDVDRIEVTTNTCSSTWRPNFKQSKVRGTFALVFAVSSSRCNLTDPEAMSKADYADVKVVFDNGSETYHLTKDDIKPLDVIYRSYILDGGKFE